MRAAIVAFAPALACAFRVTRRGEVKDLQSASPLAESAWPMTHQNIRQTGTSSLPGLRKPLGSCSKDQQFDVLLSPAEQNFTETWSMANTVSMSFEPGNEHFWAATFGLTYRAAIDKERPEDADLPIVACSRALDFEFHGAYAFINEKGEFFTSLKESILRYRFSGRNSADGCQELINDTFIVPDLTDDDAIVGMTVTPAPSSVILYATRIGRLGALTQDFEPLTELDLSEFGEISNSIGQDNEGGVYIVTTDNVLRVKWSPENRTLTMDWSTSHGSGDVLLPGRLGTGVGSTPSIMIAGSNSYVVVTDGNVPMNLLLFRTSDGAVVANETVLFDGPDTTSEQSVAVLGNKMLVVNNYIGTFDELPKWAQEEPSLLGLVGYGVSQYEWDEDSQTLSRKWTNKEISCATSIPTASGAASTPYAYCAGKRGPPVYDAKCRGERLPEPIRQGLKLDAVETLCGNWTLEAMNWETGESEFHVDLGSSFKFNPLYAATQIGANGTMYYGSFGGFVKISNNPSCL